MLRFKIESRTMNVKKEIFERIISDDQQEQDDDNDNDNHEILNLKYCHHICQKLSGKLEYVKELELVRAVTFQVEIELLGKKNRLQSQDH